MTIYFQMGQQSILNAAHMKGKCFALPFKLTASRTDSFLNPKVGSFFESKITDAFRFENLFKNGRQNLLYISKSP